MKYLILISSIDSLISRTKKIINPIYEIIDDSSIKNKKYLMIIFKEIHTFYAIDSYKSLKI